MLFLPRNAFPNSKHCALLSSVNTMLRGQLTSVLYSIAIGLLWTQVVIAADKPKEKACTIHDGDNFYNLNKLSAA